MQTTSAMLPPSNEHPGGTATQRIARLLERLEAAAASWADAEYQKGIDTGRHGVVSARVTKRRGQAEQKLKDLVLELQQATKRRPSGQ
jgi:hypothetical protein